MCFLHALPGAFWGSGFSITVDKVLARLTALVGVILGATSSTAEGGMGKSGEIEEIDAAMAICYLLSAVYARNSTK